MVSPIHQNPRPTISSTARYPPVTPPPTRKIRNMSNRPQNQRPRPGPYSFQYRPIPRLSPAVREDIHDRMSRMSQHDIYASLMMILSRSAEARVEFDALHWTPPSMPRPAVTSVVARPERIEEEGAQNEFVEIVRKTERSIQRQLNALQPDSTKANRLEDTVEKAIKSVGAGCSTTLIDESEDEYGGYYITETTRTIDYSTRRDGLTALVSLANTIIDVKEGAITGQLNGSTMFEIAREMGIIGRFLKPHEKEQLLRDGFAELLANLTDRTDQGWKTYFEQVATIIQG